MKRLILDRGLSATAVMILARRRLGCCACPEDRDAGSHRHRDAQVPGSRLQCYGRAAAGLLIGNDRVPALTAFAIDAPFGTEA
jgi:hypothetical protein